MELSVVIPIYHSAKNATEYLPEVVQALRKHYKDFEILFIIDNISVDEEVKGLFAFQKDNPEIKIHPLNKNYGQHFATLCGYYLAAGEYILSIDEDMTKYVTEICRTDDYQSKDVYYWHYDKNYMYTSDIRKAFSNLFKVSIEKIVNFQKNSTFRVISRELRDKLLEDKHIFWNLDVMIFDNTYHIGGRNIEHFDVRDDESSYNYKKLLRVAFEIAYEHNTIFMNSLISFIPALLFFALFRNIRGTIGVYILMVILMTILFAVTKNFTSSTREKITKAIKL